MEPQHLRLLLLLMLLRNVASSPLQLLGTGFDRVHFIGDLHGDVFCTQDWVSTTGAVDLTSNPWRWTGGERGAIVFMGDYVDKGNSSRAVLDFVRALKEQFPRRVLALLGNHDLFAMLDATLAPGAARPMGAPVHDFSYAFMHVEEYVQSGFSPARSDDGELLGAILAALQSVYARDAEGKVSMSTDAMVPSDSRNPGAQGENLFEDAPPFRGDVALAARARARLDQWRSEWSTGLVESGLAAWLRRRPVAAIVGDALVVHGGVPSRALRRLAARARRRGESTAAALHAETNVAFWEQWHHSVGAAERPHAERSGFRAHLVAEAVQHRGYFNKRRGCAEVAEVVELLSEARVRVRVGAPHRCDSPGV